MSLKNLIALQKQKQTNFESSAPAATPPPQAAGSAETESQAEQEIPPVSPAKPKGLGLNVAGSKAFKPAATPPPTKTPASAKPKPKAIESDGFSLEDLASLRAEDVAIDSASSDGSGFDDEIEATAPDRDLPADLAAEQISFVESLDGIYGVLHDAEMFGQTVRMIMIELQDNPEYERLVSDSDVHVMIRGMRRTMGLARVRKQEKSRKATTNKNARKTSGVSDGAMELLNSLMGGGDD